MKRKHRVLKARRHARTEAEKVSKESVHYRSALPGGDQRCGNCIMFHLKQGQGKGSCDLVRGVISKEDTCDRWAGI